MPHVPDLCFADGQFSCLEFGQLRLRKQQKQLMMLARGNLPPGVSLHHHWDMGVPDELPCRKANAQKKKKAQIPIQPVQRVARERKVPERYQPQTTHDSQAKPRAPKAVSDVVKADNLSLPPALQQQYQEKMATALSQFQKQLDANLKEAQEEMTRKNKREQKNSR